MKQLTLSFALLCSSFWLSAETFLNVPITPSIISANENPGKDFDFTVIALQSGTLTLKVKLPKNEDAYIYFEDKSGIPVSSKKIRTQDGDDFVNIDISELPNNSYRLTMASGTKRVSKTILIPK